MLVALLILESRNSIIEREGSINYWLDAGRLNRPNHIELLAAVTHQNTLKPDLLDKSRNQRERPT